MDKATREIIKEHLTEYYLMTAETADHAIDYAALYSSSLFKEDCSIESLAEAVRETYLASKHSAC